MKLEQKAKIYGITGTLLFYAALFLLLWFWVLDREELGEEQGLSVAIGVDEEGGNDFFEPAPASEIEQLLAALDAEPLLPETEELQTQDLEESVAIPAKKEKTPEELQREQERLEELRKAAEAKALKEAQDKKAEEIGSRTRNLFGGNGAGGSGNSNSSTGQGTGQGSGSPGNPFGSPDAVNREGSGAGSGSGHSYSLAGRSLRGELIRPTYAVSEEGKIVVTIIVNKEGSVVNANIGSGTNIDNHTLRKAAIDAAKKTKFNKINSEKNQSGTITYTFKLQ
ncbi:MAG: energy transducer TonB [Prevotellaceae bacterium]|jgi:TonB family protein|nr:energy transducer TonB [Prevotellaceae bacterium]